MPLTAAQLATLKADILANTNAIPQGMANAGAFVGVQIKDIPNDSGDGNLAVASWYNLNASPDYWVWRTSVAKGEYVNATSVDGTTFNWTGAGFITRSQGERDAWREMFNGTNTVNPSLAQVRQAFSDIFSGATAPAPANRTHMSAISRRNAKNGEKLFATGAGSTVAPSVMGYEGNISLQDVNSALNLPG